MSLEGTGKCHTVTLRRHAVMAAGKMAAPIEFAADLCIGAFDLKQFCTE